MIPNYPDPDEWEQDDELSQEGEAAAEPDSDYSRHLEELADQLLMGEQLPPEAVRLDRTDLADQTLDALLLRLATDPSTIAPLDLLILSNLPRDEIASLQLAWPTIPVERRREVVHYLAVLAEEDLSLQFGQLFRIALADPDSETRRNAIAGLWEDGRVDLIGPLVQITHNDLDAKTRAVAAALLGSYVLAGELDEIEASLAVRAEEALLAIMAREDEVVAVRCRALESLAYSSEVGVRQLIEEAYYAPEEELRLSSLIAMGRSADVRWRGLVRAELQNPAPEMRAAAAYACGELEAKASLREIVDLVSDDDPDVRIAAILALGQIGGKEAREVLETVRSSSDEDEVTAADYALEELMFLASLGTDPSLLDDEEILDDWDIEPWQRGFDLDDLDLGTYEE